MDKAEKNYSAAIAKCSPNCPGRISPWRAALGEEYACPLGVAFCGIWDADNIIVKRKSAVARVADGQEDAA